MNEPVRKNETSISLIVPAYNEASRIHLARGEFEDAISLGHLSKDEVQLILVDDGSEDRTRDLMESELTGLFTKTLVIGTEKNIGKGNAIKSGISKASSPYSVFMDLDMATSPRFVKQLIGPLENGFDFSIGSRSHIDSELVQSDKTRRSLGRSYNRLVRLLTGIEFLDTQCGFKGFRTDVGKLLCHFCSSPRFVFDVELILLAQQIGFRMCEVPVEWTDVPGSKVRVVRDSARMLADLLHVKIVHDHPEIVGLVFKGNPEEAQCIVQGSLNQQSQATICFINQKKQLVILFPLIDRETYELIESLLKKGSGSENFLKVDYSIEDLADDIQFLF